MPEEKDLSFPYMQQSDHCDITLIGGDNITKPVYCINCKMKRPLDPDFPMNMSQALDHVVHVHNESAGHRVDMGGYKALQRNEERYRRWKIAQYQPIKEATAAARLKKVLA